MWAIIFEKATLYKKLTKDALLFIIIYIYFYLYFLNSSSICVKSLLCLYDEL